MAKPLGGLEGNSWKNVLIAILTTALITSTTGWFAFGQDTVRKDELIHLQASVAELTKSVHSLTTEMAVLNVRMRTAGTQP